MLDHSSDLRFYVFLWIGLTFAITFIQWKRSVAGTGLIVTLLFQLWGNYGLGGLIYALPNHPLLFWEEFGGSDFVWLGFKEATVGLIGLGIGSALLGPVLSDMFRKRFPINSQALPEERLIYFYIAIGLASYFLIGTISEKIETLTAFAAAGWRMMLIGLCLLVWKKWREGNQLAFAGVVVAATCIVPTLTILTRGFLSYGAIAVLTLHGFIVSFFQPRWKIAVVGLLVSYLGISVFVTYMRDRTEIRNAVWGGVSMTERADTLSLTSKGFEFFNPNSAEHLNLIDARLNQNFLVGASVNYIQSGFANFANGNTVFGAFLALVPRIFWPDKPATGGSGSLVSDYTGIGFAEGTSVGIGPIMECYINFGSVGVFVGFLILGILLAILDSSAGEALRNGDWKRFSYMYLPGISLVDVSGALAEVISSAGAGLAFAWVVNNLFLRKLVEGPIPAKSSNSS